MIGTEQHTGFGGGGMDEDRRLTITWSYGWTWRTLRSAMTECTALTVWQHQLTFSEGRGNRFFLS
jgi:hypothetical protein